MFEKMYSFRFYAVGSDKNRDYVADKEYILD